MKNKETKINRKKPIVQDIKKVEIKIPSAEKIEEKTLVRKSLFFKLFFLIVTITIIIIGIKFVSFKNEDSSERMYAESGDGIYYYANKIKDTLVGTENANKNDITEEDYEYTEEENSGYALEEASSRSRSESEDWWLNSGGVMYFQEKGFSTNTGPLPEDSYWRELYYENNPRDTDDGYFPQNIFRLVSREKWKNFSQSVYFNIRRNNLSESQYRNESNGVLLFNRYQDGDNLYYAGLRVDGHVIIKKKIDGEYFTMVEKNIFKNKDEYDWEDNPNLIPKNTWIGIKSELENINDDEVEIKLFVDHGNGEWNLVAKTKDKEDEYGDAPFLGSGYVGIRTDFMDVKFKDYNIDKK